MHKPYKYKTQFMCAFICNIFNLSTTSVQYLCTLKCTKLNLFWNVPTHFPLQYECLITIFSNFKLNFSTLWNLKLYFLVIRACILCVCIFTINNDNIYRSFKYWWLPHFQCSNYICTIHMRSLILNIFLYSKVVLTIRHTFLRWANNTVTIDYFANSS